MNISILVLLIGGLMLEALIIAALIVVWRRTSDMTEENQPEGDANDHT